MDKKYLALLETLENSPSPLTGKELSRSLSVSIRSIQNYIQQINNTYPEKIILSTTSGYSVNNYVLKKYVQYPHQNIPNSKQERIKYLVKAILTRTEEINTFTLEEEMFISHSTLRSVIKDANTWLSPYNLHIKTKKNILCIVGNKHSIQKVIQNMISDDASAKLLEIQSLYDFFSKEYVEKIIKILDLLEMGFKIKINEFTKTNLILHFCFLFNDVTQQCTDTVHSNNELCNSLNHYIHDYFGYYLSNSSIEESILLLQTHSDLGINYEDISIYFDFIKTISKEIEKNYYFSLSNKQFSIPFANHIRNLVLRATSNCCYKNPLLENIKANAPFIFDISVHISLLLTKQFHIEVSEDEIAYIALHVGAEINRQNQTLKSHIIGLCIPKYLDLHNQIKHKIHSFFKKNIIIIDYNPSDSQIPDLILSTFSKSNLDIPDNIPFLEISPFFNRTDIDNLFFAIEELKELDAKHILYSNFDLFFQPNLFIYSNDFKDEFEVINYLCDNLISQEYAPANFKEHVINREKTYPTSFGKIAIPHQFFTHSTKTGIYTVVSKNGIRWGKNTVHLVFLICVTDEDKKTFSLLYESLLNLFTDEQILEQIIKRTSFEEFRSITLSSTI